MRVNEKLPIFAALRKERDPIFVFESGREKERERGENERLDDISLNLARVRVYLAAGETAHGDDHVCSESNLYFPPAWRWFFFVCGRRKNVTSVLFLHLSPLVQTPHLCTHILLQKGLVLKPVYRSELCVCKDGIVRSHALLFQDARTRRTIVYVVARKLGLKRRRVGKHI